MNFAIVLALLSASVCYARRTDTHRPFFRREGQTLNLGRGRTLSYNEAWGYVDVREQAHMFWWLYASTSSDATRPLVLWLQGGPGGSGVGFGNFDELGPLNTDLLPRNTTWLQKADLLFVDNPVGTGYSYVDDLSKLTKTVEEISHDLLMFSKKFFGVLHPEYQKRPFYIFCESYGGKMTPHFAMVLHKAIEAGQIKVNLQGIGIGDGWVSAIDYVQAWGPYLYATSWLDTTGLAKVQKVADQCSQLVKEEEWLKAEECWGQSEGTIMEATDGVSWYNILKNGGADPWSLAAARNREGPRDTYKSLFSRHVNYTMVGFGEGLDKLMNGPIKRKLKIIPASVSWGGQAGDVFSAQAGDFMKPVIYSVDYLLANTTVKVAVFNGQLDLICTTAGTITWLQKLQWEHREAFFASQRSAFSLPGDSATAGFSKSYDRLALWWILRAGHMVSHDAADAALEMLGKIIAWTP